MSHQFQGQGFFIDTQSGNKFKSVSVIRSFGVHCLHWSHIKVDSEVVNRCEWHSQKMMSRPSSIYKIMTFTSPVVWIHLVIVTLGRCQYWSEAQQEQCRFDNFSIPRSRDDEPWKVTWSTGGLLMLSKYIFSVFL